MRVKLTVFYGEEGTALVKVSKDYHLLTEDEDPDSFSEAKDYLIECLYEPYVNDNHELEDDDDEPAVGTDYLAAWLLPEWFDTRKEATDFAKQFIKDADQTLADLE